MLVVSNDNENFIHVDDNGKGEIKRRRALIVVCWLFVQSIGETSGLSWFHWYGLCQWGMDHGLADPVFSDLVLSGALAVRVESQRKCACCWLRLAAHWWVLLIDFLRVPSQWWLECSTTCLTEEWSNQAMLSWFHVLLLLPSMPPCYKCCVNKVGCFFSISWRMCMDEHA
jgi:hypothetical protein